jgi:hypothetical protein
MMKAMCDPAKFLGISRSTMGDFKRSISNSSVNPNCDVGYTTSSGSTIQPAIHYAIRERSSLPPGYLDAILSSPLGTIDANEQDSAGNSVFKLMITGTFSVDEIYETISALTFRPNAKGFIPTEYEIDMAIDASRDDVVARVLLPRMNIQQIQSKFVTMVTKKLINSVEIALERGANPIGTLAFHQAINVNDSNIFRMLLSKCCIVSDCVDNLTDLAGKTARELALPGSIFLTTIEDATLTKRGCI